MPIPKIIHRWWGGGPMPVRYKHDFSILTSNGFIVLDWYEERPGVIHSPLYCFDFTSHSLFDRYTRAWNYSNKSNIIRLLLVHHYGGAWFDTDVIPLRDMSDLFESRDFFAAWEASRDQIVGYAVFGSSPQSEIMCKLVNVFKRDYNPDPQTQAAEVMESGPGLFTKGLREHIGKGGDINKLLIAPKLIYPFPPGYTKTVEEANKTFAIIDHKPVKPYTLHLWDATWIKSWTADMERRKHADIH